MVNTFLLFMKHINKYKNIIIFISKITFKKFYI